MSHILNLTDIILCARQKKQSIRVTAQPKAQKTFQLEINNQCQELIQKGNQIKPELNKIKGIQITSLENGTNSYNMEIDQQIEAAVLSEVLRRDFNMI
ncbi:unnamed protein product, partial [marine sediment metagenome]